MEKNKKNVFLYKKYKFKRNLKKFFFKDTRIQKKRFKNAKVISAEQTQDYIKDIIKESLPCMIARYGSNEAELTADTIGLSLGCIEAIPENRLKSINRDAGLFPYGDETAVQFGQLMEESSKDVDLLGYWDTGMQDYLIDNICSKDIKLTEFKNLEPYYFNNPWSESLKGKKVVVVHPFKESIESQYKKRDLLFPGTNILPEFNLRVVKAIQTAAGQADSNFESWFSALDYMFTEIMSENFDVAIIGCGAYGFPLASRIKKAGKISIHLGGATQILFGIKGKRWDNHPIVSKMYNDNWVRPLETEKPQNAKLIENACYW